jgi:FixJ family two-component response regulator
MEQCPREERSLRLTAARAANGRVEVEVRDAGCGIAAERLDRLFEPFQTTRKDGLGLGLAICRSIVEAHGGTIGVARNAERGVTLRFDLAGEPGPRQQPAPPAARDGALRPAAAAAGPLVCVVDDDAGVRESLARLLSAEGFAVLCYPSAEEFLAAAAVAETACVLVDLQLPGMSGIELQERLALTSFTPPIVFLTSGGDVAASVAAMKRGAIDFLSKPADHAQLLAAVRTALEQSAGSRMIALRRGARAERLGRLSPRERQVMEHVIQGRLNKQIAASLSIALQTVKQHRARVMEKMEAGSVPDLLRILGPDQPPSAISAPTRSAPTADMPAPASQRLPPA